MSRPADHPGDGLPVDVFVSYWPGVRRPPADAHRAHPQRRVPRVPPGGHLLASGSADGTARLWTVAGGQAARHLTLLGLPDGWAVLSPDGRYKTEGTVGGQFWHVVGMCRFEPGDLDDLLPEIRLLPPDSPF